MQVLGWLHDGVLVGAYLLVIIPFLPTLISLLLALRVGEDPRNKLLRSTHGRYIGPGELDESSRSLLARAQRAVDLVLDSEVHRAGLLDSVHNNVVLPHQEWEIAKALRGLSQLRQRHPDLSVPAGEGDAVSPAARTFNEALENIDGRVQALERYAEQVKAADVAYSLSAAADGASSMALEDLTSQAHHTEQALADRVRQAREAAALLADAPSP